MLSCGADGGCLSIGGTRFSAGKLCDLPDDVDVRAVAVGGSALVTRGAYEGCTDLWARTKGRVSPGGWRATYTPLLLPKGANLAYYLRFSAELAGLVIVGSGADCWFGYPRLEPRRIHRPGEMLHLLPQGFRVIDAAAWPGGIDFSVHDMDRVVERLAAIASPLEMSR